MALRARHLSVVPETPLTSAFDRFAGKRWFVRTTFTIGVGEAIGPLSYASACALRRVLLTHPDVVEVELHGPERKRLSAVRRSPLDVLRSPRTRP